MARAITGVLKIGAKLAFKMGKREPTRKLASLFCPARNVACSRLTTALEFKASVAVNWSRESPNRVVPFPKVARGWEKSEFCLFYSCANSADNAVELAWL